MGNGFGVALGKPLRGLCWGVWHCYPGTLRDPGLRCFDRFAVEANFVAVPTCDASARERIRKLGEQLDAHRKRQQAAHPDLTMTGMYNVLEKLRAAERAKREGEAPAEPNRGEFGQSKSGSARASPSQDHLLTPKERKIHEQGLVSVLKQIHDELDAAVFDAYGWPHDLTDEEILQRLVDLNHERAAEEARGLICWLRPEFQNAAGTAPSQTKLDIAGETTKPAKPAAKAVKQPWPASLPDRVSVVRTALIDHAEPALPGDIAKCFKNVRKKDVIEEILDTLVAVGQARQTDDGRYVA